MGVELVKIAGGGSDLLRCATDLAKERGGYFVHPHLDPLWTDGYQSIAAELLRDLPTCRSLVFPVGGGGLLMGLLAYLRKNPAPVRLFGCEPYNYPKYARFDHARSTTIADGLILETPHPQVQQAIADGGVAISLVPEPDIRARSKTYSKRRRLWLSRQARSLWLSSRPTRKSSRRRSASYSPVKTSLTRITVD